MRCGDGWKGRSLLSFKMKYKTTLAGGGRAGGDRRGPGEGGGQEKTGISQLAHYEDFSS